MTQASEIPAHVLAPAYWNNHWIDDSCPWEDRSKLLPSGYNPDASEKARKLAEKAFLKFKRNPNRAVHRRFIAGQPFDGTLLPLETVISINEEYLWFEDGIAVANASFIYWGVTIAHPSEYGHSVSLSVLGDELFQQNNFDWSVGGKSPIINNIGLVIHKRDIEIPEKQELERTNWIDVWQVEQNKQRGRRIRAVWNQIVPRLVGA